MRVPRARELAAVLALGTALSLSADQTQDQVKLRSGKVIAGMFVGADSRSIRVLLDNGSVSEISLSEALTVEFAPRKPTPPPPPPTAPARTAPPTSTTTASAPQPAPQRRVTIPAGTAVNVRLSQGIDVDASRAGQTFKAVVDDPVMVGGSIVVPRGASAIVQAVQVEQSGKMKGSDKISLKLNAIGFGGMVYDVATSYVESKGKGEGRRTARKIGGGAGLGAIVGGIAGGGEGAAIGAAVGAVTGTAVASAGEEHLKLPAETRLQFQLTSAVTIRL
jgi:hypothetical protein